VLDHLVRRHPDADELAVTVTARCVAAAVFAGMEVWMRRDDRSLPDLATLCRDALESVASGLPLT
jgi:hypothetical protein